MPKNHQDFCTFYIVRHGETDWNASQRIQGQSDIPLNEKGKSQAAAIGESLKDVHFDAIYSSDLLRAKQTAKIAAKQRALIIQTTKLLRERFFGRLEGKQKDALRAIHKHLTTLSKEELPKYTPYEGYESDEALMSRFITFLREVAVGSLSETVLVVSHGGLMRSLLVHLGFGTYKDLSFSAISNAGYIKLISDGVDFFITETKGITKSSQKV